jgi:hypothetical protein
MGNVSVKAHKHKHSKHCDRGHKRKCSRHQRSRHQRSRHQRRYYGGIGSRLNPSNKTRKSSPATARKLDLSTGILRKVLLTQAHKAKAEERQRELVAKANRETRNVASKRSSKKKPVLASFAEEEEEKE